MTAEKYKGKKIFRDILVEDAAEFQGPVTTSGDNSHTGQETFTGEIVPGASNAGSDVTAATDVAATSSVAQLVRKTVLTVTDMAIAVLDANDFGSAKLADLPDSNLILLAAEADLSFVKDGTGYIAGTDLDAAIGTAAATAADLTATAAENNIVNSTDINADALTVDFEAHSNDNGSPANLYIADGASNSIYLNVSGPTETSEDGALTVSGTVTLFWLDVGNVTS